MNEFKRFTRDVVIVYIVELLLLFQSFILIPIISKNITQDLYGVWSQLRITVSLLVPFAVLSLQRAMIRFLPSLEDRNKKSIIFSSIFFISIFLSLIFGFIIFLFSSQISLFILKSSTYSDFISFVGLLLFVLSINEIVIYYFRSYRKMISYSLVSLFKAYGELFLIYYMLYFGYGLRGVIIAVIFADFIVDLFALFLIFNDIGISFPRLSYLDEYFKFSIPLIFAPFLFWILQLSDQYIIGFFFGASAVGLYSINYSLAYIINNIRQPITIVLLPTISKYWNEGNIEKAKIYIEYSYKYSLLLVIPICVVFVAFFKFIIPIISTQDYVGSFMLMLMLVLGAFFSIIYASIRKILEMMKKTKIIRNLLLFLVFINLSSNFVLIPIYGVTAAAFTTFVTFFIGTLSIAKIISTDYKFNYMPLFFFKSLIASLLMSFAISFLPMQNIFNWIIVVPVGVLFYFLLLILVKAIKFNEIMFFLSFIKLDTIFLKVLK